MTDQPSIEQQLPSPPKSADRLNALISERSKPTRHVDLPYASVMGPFVAGRFNKAEPAHEREGVGVCPQLCGVPGLRHLHDADTVSMFDEPRHPAGTAAEWWVHPHPSLPGLCQSILPLIEMTLRRNPRDPSWWRTDIDIKLDVHLIEHPWWGTELVTGRADCVASLVLVRHRHVLTVVSDMVSSRN